MDLQLPDDADTPRFLSLSFTADGTRLFAADGNNNSIKCVDLSKRVVYRAYKSKCRVCALQVREKKGDDGATCLAALEVYVSEAEWAYQLTLLEEKGDNSFQLLTTRAIAERTTTDV